MIFVYIIFTMFFYLLHPQISCLYACLFAILFVQSYQDIVSLEVSNGMMFLLFFIVISICRIEHLNSSFMILGACSVSSIFFVLYVISKGKAIGGADVKFMFLCGLFLGYQHSLLSLFYACMSALPYHIYIYKEKSELPFIPFLSLGVYLALFSI